jgi:hypothetical protein
MTAVYVHPIYHYTTTESKSTESITQNSDGTWTGCGKSNGVVKCFLFQNRESAESYAEQIALDRSGDDAKVIGCIFGVAAIIIVILAIGCWRNWW